MVAARKIGHGSVEARRPDAQPIDEPSRNSPLGAAVDEIKPADEVGNGERDVVLDAAHQQQRLRLPVLGRKAYPRRDRVGGALEAYRPAVHRDRSRQHAVMAEDRLGQFRTSGAHQAGETDDLARMDVEAHVADALRRQAAHGKGRLAAASRSPLIEVGDRPADHGLNDFRFGELRRRPFRDQPPVAQHRHAIRQIPHFAHPVRNIDDADAVVVPEPPHHAEEPLRLLLGQGRGRLVQREHAQAAAKRPHDLHQLALGGAQIARPDPWPEILLEPESGQHLARAPLKIGAVEKHPVDAAKVAEKQILGDGQVRNDVRLLMDDPDSQRMGVGGRSERLGGAADLERSLIGPIDALENAHERRLSRAVLADQRQDLARPHRKRHIVQRLDNAEAL